MLVAVIMYKPIMVKSGILQGIWMMVVTGWTVYKPLDCRANRYFDLTVTFHICSALLHSAVFSAK